MKANFRRFLAVLLTVALLWTSAAPAFADEVAALYSNKKSKTTSEEAVQTKGTEKGSDSEEEELELAPPVKLDPPVVEEPEEKEPVQQPKKKQAAAVEKVSEKKQNAQEDTGTYRFEHTFPSVTYDGKPHSATITNMQKLSGATPAWTDFADYEIWYTKNGTSSDASTDVNQMVDAGTYHIVIYDLTGSRSRIVTNATCAIASATVTVTAPASPVYDGNEHPVTVTGIVAGDNYSISYTKSSKPVTAPVDAGTYLFTVSCDTNNYNVNVTTGSFTISQATVTVTKPASDSLTYNGNPKPVAVTGVLPQDTYTVTYNGSLEAPVDAGAYDYKVNVGDNYKIATSGTDPLEDRYTITPASVTVTWPSDPITYDGSAHEIEPTKVQDSANKDVPYTVSYSANPVNAGTYTATLNVGSNYTASNLTHEFTIAKATAVAAFRNTVYAHTGYSIVPEIVVTGNGQQLAFDATPGSGSSDWPSDVGDDYTATVTLRDDTNFEFAPASGSGTGTRSTNIGPYEIAAATARVDYSVFGSIEYDGAEHKPTVTIFTSDSVELVEDQDYTVTYAPGTNAYKNAGAYDTIVTLSNPTNYTLVNGSSRLTITKAPLIITAHDKTAAAGAAPSSVTLTKSVSGTKGSDTAAVADAVALKVDVAENVTALDAGTYSIVEAGNTKTLDNYTYTVTPGTLTVGKADVAVTWPETKSKTYNGATVTDFNPTVKSGDTPLTIDTDYTVVTTGDFTSAGTHTKQVVLTANGKKKYNDPSNAIGTYTISKVALTAEPASDTTKVTKEYDGTTNATVTADMIKLTGLVTGNDVQVSVGSAAFDAAGVSASRRVTANVSLAGTMADNYTLSNTAVLINGVISQRTLTITADGKSLNVGDIVPADGFFSYNVTGLVGSDSVGTVSYTLGTGAPTPGGVAETPGTFTITPSVGSDATTGLATNYDINYVPGNLVVSKKTITIKAADVEITYGGTVASDALIVIGPAGVDVSDYEAKVKTSVTPASLPVGTHPDSIEVQLKSGHTAPANYNVELQTGALKVNKADVTVTWPDTKTAVYSGAEKNFAPSSVTANGQPLTTGATGDYTVVVTQGDFTSVGSHQKTVQLTATGKAKYNDPANETGTFTITPKPVTASAASSARVTKLYDANTSAIVTANMISLSGVETTDTDYVKVSVGSAAFNTPTVGTTKTVTANISLTGAQAGNYTLSSPTVTIDGTINPKKLTITALNKSLKVGEILPAAGFFDYNVTGLVGDDTVGTIKYTLGSGAPTPGAAATTPGTFTITPAIDSGATADLATNYDINYVDGKLVVGQGSVTLEADPVTIFYGDALPQSSSLTFSASDGKNYTQYEAYIDTTGQTTPLAVNSYKIIKVRLKDGASAPADVVIVTQPGILTVNKADVTVAWPTGNDAKKPYTGAKITSFNAPTVTANGNALTITVDYTVDETLGDFINVGEHQKTVKLTDAGKLKYNDPTSAIGTFEITPKSVSASVKSGAKISKVYDGNTNAIVTADMLELTGVYTDDTDEVALLVGSATYDSATYGTSKTVTANLGLTGTKAKNYMLSTTTASFTGSEITKRTLTVTTPTIHLNVGDTLTKAQFTSSVDGLIEGDQTGEITYTPGTGAPQIGSKATTAGEFDFTTALGNTALSTNYTIHYENGKLVVSPKTITLTPRSYTITYGDAVPTLEYTASDGSTVRDYTADLASGTTSTRPLPVGTYTIELTAPSTPQTGVNIDCDTGTLTVLPATVTVTAYNMTVAKGSDVPGASALKWSAGGFKGTDTEAILNGFTLKVVEADDPTTDLADTNTVGDYPIVQKEAPSTTPANYTLVVIPGTLFVTEKPAAVASAVGTTFTFDDSAKTPTIAVTSAGKVLDPTTDYTLAYTGNLANKAKTAYSSNQAPKQAGSYTVTVTLTPAAQKEYELVGGTAFPFTIEPAKLTVIWEGYEDLTYTGNVIATVTAKYNTPGSGSSGTTPCKVTFDPTPLKNAGTYIATASFDGDNEIFNYVLTNETKTIVVAKKPLTIVPEPATKVYGSVDPALTYAVEDINGDAVTGVEFTGALSRAPGEDVMDTSGTNPTTASYPINIGTLTAGDNYALTLDSTVKNLTITPAPLTIKADDKVATYGTTPMPALSSTVTGLVRGDTLNTASINYTNGTGGSATEFTLDSTTAAGVYTSIYPVAPTATDFPKASNYTITPVAGTVTVNKKMVDVEWLGEVLYLYNNGNAIASLPTITETSKTALGYDESANPPTTPTITYSKVTGNTEQAVTGDVKDIGNYVAKLDTSSLTNYDVHHAKFNFAVDTKPTEVEASFTNTTFNTARSAVYTGEAQEYPVTLKIAGTGGATIDPSEYTVEYTDNIDVGTATVTIIDKAGLGYTFTQQTLTFEITPATLTLNKNPAINNKPYDGTTKATLDFTGVSLDGVLPTTAGSTKDNVQLDTEDYTATFNSKDAATNIPVLITLKLKGAKAGNYELTQPSGNNLVANITQRELSLTDIIINDKPYDGAATATIKSVKLAGVVEGEEITLNVDKLSATFNDTTGAVGQNKPVTVDASASGVLTVPATSSTILTNYALKKNGNDEPKFEATGNITKRVLVVKGLTAITKVYDGTQNVATTGTGALTIAATNIFEANGTTQFAPPVSSTVTITPNAKFVTKKATVQNVDIIAYELDSTSASNYEIDMVKSQKVITGCSITALPVYVQAGYITAANKQYDGNTNATLTINSNVTPVLVNAANSSDSGILTNDHVKLVATGAVGTFASANVGDNKDVTVTSLVLTGDGVGNDSANYALQPYTTKANITEKILTLTNISVTPKTYDGKTDATVTFDINGLVGSETVAFTTDSIKAAATFDNANAGTGKTVTIDLKKLEMTTGTYNNNYKLYAGTDPTAAETPTAKGTIYPKKVTLKNVTAANKTYDGNVTATFNANAVTVWEKDDDTIQVNLKVKIGTGGSATFADKNAGDNKTVTITNLELVDNSTYLASNYELDSTTYTTDAANPVKIEKRHLHTKGTITFQGKEYDGNDVAVMNITGLELDDSDPDYYIVSYPTGEKDDVSLDVANSVAHYDGYLVAPHTIHDFTIALRGDDKDNYVVDMPSGYTLPTDTYQITKRQLKIIGGLYAESKDYNGTNEAVVKVKDNDDTNILLDRVVLGDIGYIGVQSSTIVAEFEDSDVGVHKKVTVKSGLTLVNKNSGNVIGNYELILDDPVLYANINQASAQVVTVSGQASVDPKVYDGTDLAKVNLGTLTVSPIYKHTDPATGQDVDDEVYVAGWGYSAYYDSPDAGTNKVVTVGNLQLGGADAYKYKLDPNYTFVVNNCVIEPQEVTIRGIEPVAKVYDGNTDATVDYENAFVDGVVRNEKLVVNTSGNGTLTTAVTGSGSGGASGTVTVTYDNKNVGYNKVITVAGLSVDAGDSTTKVSNYKLLNDTVVLNNGVITPKHVTVSGITASNKTYDGNTTATVNAASAKIDGKVDGDNLSVTASGNFADKNVGEGKSVNLNIGLTGTDVGNYTLAGGSQTYTTASITAKDVTVTLNPVTKTWAYTWTEPDWDNPDAAWYTISGLLDSDEATIQMGRTGDNHDVKNSPFKNALHVKSIEIKDKYTQYLVPLSNYKITTTTADFIVEPWEVGAKILLNGMDFGNDSTPDTSGKRGFTWTGGVLKPVVTLLDPDGHVIPYSLGEDSEYKWDVQVGGSTTTPTDAANDGKLYTVVIQDKNDKGNYKISSTLADGDPNYSIYPMVATLTWTNTSLEYTGSLQKPTAKVTGYENDFIVTVSGDQRDTNSDNGTSARAGKDPYYATATVIKNTNGTSQANVILPTEEQDCKKDFYIYPAPAQVRIQKGISKTYGENDPELVVDQNYSLIGLKMRDGTTQETAQSIGLTGKITRAAGENVGTYAYDISGLTTTDKNYVFTLDAVDGATALTINTKQVYVGKLQKQDGDIEVVTDWAWDDTNTKWYSQFNNAEHKPVVTLTDTTKQLPEDLVPAVIPSSEYTVAHTPNPVKNAGNYSFTIADNAGGNYEIISRDANYGYRIDPIEVKIEWNCNNTDKPLIYNGEKQIPVATITMPASATGVDGVKLSAKVEVTNGPAIHVNDPTTPYYAVIKKLEDAGTTPAVPAASWSDFVKNFTFDDTTHEFNIAPADLELTVTGFSKAYLDAEPDPLGTLTVAAKPGNTLQTGDTLGEYTLVREGVKGAEAKVEDPTGSYPLTVAVDDKGNVQYDILKSGKSVKDDYNVFINPGFFTIYRRFLEVKTAMVEYDDSDKIYQGTFYTPKVTVKDTEKGKVLTEGVDYAVVYTDNIDHGTARITLQDLAGLDDNYILDFHTVNTLEPMTFRILQKEIGLEWSTEDTFEFDGKWHMPTATATGLCTRIDNTRASGQTDLCDVIVVGQERNVGTYYAQAASLSNDNYKLPTDYEKRSKEFTIEAMSVTVTGLKALDKVYDGTKLAKIDVSEAVVTGAKKGDKLSVVAYGEFDTKDVVLKDGKPQPKPVTVTVKLEGLNGDNYEVKVEDELTATITPATLTIEAIKDYKVFNTPDPDPFDYHAVGFKGVDTKKLVMKGALTREGVKGAAPKKDDPVGKYKLLLGTLSAEPNYTIDFNDNDFIIVKSESDWATVVIEPKTLVYNGKPRTVENGDIKVSVYLDEAKTELIPASEYTLIYKDNKDVGTATVIVVDTNNEGNYKVMGRATFEIVPAGLTVTADDLIKVYGDPDPALTYKVEGLQGADTAEAVLTGALVREKAGTPEGENVGVYAITQGTLAVVGGNYKLTFVPGTLTIVAKKLIVKGVNVTISDVPRTYDGTKHTPPVTVTVDGVVIPAVEYTVTYENNINAGVAEIELTDVPGGNYDLTFDIVPKLTFDILPREIGIVWAPLQFIYDGQLHVPTATATGLIGDDICLISVSYNGVPIPAGTYTAFATDVSNKNYRLPENNKTDYVILPRGVEVHTTDVILSKKVYTYDGKEHKPTVTVIVDGQVMSPTEYIVSYLDNIHAGTATVVLKDAPGGNYTLDFKLEPPVTFTIRQRTAKLAWAPLTFEYDGEQHLPEATVTNLVKGDECKVTVKPEGEKAINIGTYYAKATKLSNKDYKLPTKRIKKFKIVRPNIDGTLILKMLPGEDGKSIDMTWTKITNVDGYDILMCLCNSDGVVREPELIKTINNNKTFSFKVEGLKKQTCYKAYVKAFIYDDNGDKVYVRSSLLTHCISTGSTKDLTNPGKLTLNVKELNLEPGETFTIIGVVEKLVDGKKLLHHTSDLRFITSYGTVATVNKHGKVTAVRAGTCTITVITNNGLSEVVKVKVR